jgi:sRNA-binding regulator protein Hfq
MPDTSAIPVRHVYDPRQAKAKPKADAAAEPSALPSISPAGPRKLVRPHLPDAGGRHAAKPIAPIFTNQIRWNQPVAGHAESSHAEAFYFQKQIQSRTIMIFLLEDGERVEGTIEWYDRNAIKVRNGNVRTLIYKICIKYLYKAGESEWVNARP